MGVIVDRPNRLLFSCRVGEILLLILHSVFFVDLLRQRFLSGKVILLHIVGNHGYVSAWLDMARICSLAPNISLKEKRRFYRRPAIM